MNIHKFREVIAAGTITRADFYELMKAEGKKIDPRSADVMWVHAQVCDPYGLGGLPEEYDCVGRNYFARALGGAIWVDFGDLPDETRAALWVRWEAGKLPVTVPFDQEVERMADAIGKLYASCMDDFFDRMGARARALEAAQAALNALRDVEHPNG
jgi:hypothetical protein